jgi:excisionase family DNA binding protein
MADADTRSERRRSAPVSGPGFASTADLVRRWRVARNTVPVLADRLELLRSVVGGTPRWTWLSVWRAEGRTNPPEELWDELKQPLLTPPEVAQLLQVSERTVRAWVARGELPAIHLSAQLRRVEPAAVATIDEAAVRRLRREVDGNGGKGAQRRQREAKAPRLCNREGRRRAEGALSGRVRPADRQLSASTSAAQSSSASAAEISAT